MGISRSYRTSKIYGLLEVLAVVVDIHDDDKYNRTHLGTNEKRYQSEYLRCGTG